MPAVSPARGLDRRIRRFSQRHMQVPPHGDRQGAHSCCGHLVTAQARECAGSPADTLLWLPERAEVCHRAGRCAPASPPAVLAGSVKPSKVGSCIFPATESSALFTLASPRGQEMVESLGLQQSMACSFSLGKLCWSLSEPRRWPGDRWPLQNGHLSERLSWFLQPPRSEALSEVSACSWDL